MTVRFKCRSEYQKSYRVPRSRSVSPQRCASTAGLRSDQMGISREPGLQRRRKFGLGGLTRSCSSLLGPPEPQLNPHALKTAPPAASRSRSALGRDSPTPAAPVNSDPAAEPETAAGPRPSADPEPSEEQGAAENNVKPLPLKNNSQSQLSRPPTAAANGPQPPAHEVQHALRWKAGLRSGGQRSGGHPSEYHRQFSWKKPIASASPLLTAEQVLYSSSRSVPPFKKHPVAMETEYQQSFQGAAPPNGPRLRKHLEQQRIPLFQTHMINKKKREESERKPRPSEDASSPMRDDTAQVQRRHRTLTEYESSFRSPLYRIPEEGGTTDGNAPQVTELRQKALSYRQRAWGANFSRDHLSQLLSEHNALWEPTDTTTDSNTAPPSPRPEPPDPRPDLGSCGSSRIEALDLPSRSSNSSKRSSVAGSGGPQINEKSPPSPAAERRTAWGEEEEENPDDEEGRLPTPRLKLFPVQRTHHDLTTPAAGGAILVGKLMDRAGSTPTDKQHRSVSAVSMAAGVETAAYVPGKPKEAWSEKSPSHHPSSGPSPEQKAFSPPSKPIKTKQTYPAHVAPPPQVPPPLHGFHGSMRHPDFQHNGELGLRFRELQCSGGCGSDEDDRMSVMSWRSAASCSMASAVLERAQKRRDNFWGKR